MSPDPRVLLGEGYPLFRSTPTTHSSSPTRCLALILSSNILLKKLQVLMGTGRTAGSEQGFTFQPTHKRSVLDDRATAVFLYIYANWN